MKIVLRKAVSGVMESKKLILCPECGNKRPKTKQHRLGKMFGANLSQRNKKIECKQCQDFFDNLTRESIEEMISKKKKKEEEKIDYDKKNYYLQNYQMVIPAGGNTVINTGSQVQSASAGVVEVPYSKVRGIPISLEFVDGAKKDEDKIKVINNDSNKGTVYLSVIVDKPACKKVDSE